MLQRRAVLQPGTPMSYAWSLSSATAGNRVELLPGGAEAFPAMLSAIAGARRQVLLESYIIAPDGTGRAFIDELRMAAERGVEVRLLCDAVGSWYLPDAWLRDVEAAGGRTLVFRPVAPWRRRWGLWRRDHRKVLVVDRTIGFVGGINLADEYDARTPPGAARAWRDLQVRVEGPAADKLAELFATVWNREQPASERLLLPSAGAPSPRSDGVTVAIVGNRETGHRTLIRRSFLHAIKQARSTVTIANPYFIPDLRIARALRRAARAGVDVRVVVPERSDIRMVDYASRATFPGLLRAGVRIAEWPGMMHAKAAAVDGRWATVGSYNFDHRSFHFNLEVTAHLLDAGAAGAVEARLRQDWKAAVELDLASFRRRPLWQRMLSALAYELRPLL